MPAGALKPCAVAGCPGLRRSPARFCEAHVELENRRTPRGPDVHIYGTARWRRLRAAVLARNPVCACGQPADRVDHIQPVSRGGDPFPDESGLRAMCLSCHQRFSAAFDGGFGNPVRPKP